MSEPAAIKLIAANLPRDLRTIYQSLHLEIRSISRRDVLLWFGDDLIAVFDALQAFIAPRQPDGAEAGTRISCATGIYVPPVQQHGRTAKWVTYAYHYHTWSFLR
ncbi:hypothetical protein [Amycolatopsis marina]|uniref:hypothetical protein n=1 Tax=Amycolatopsis marina TaxID=490629 RepID=UPI001160B684|nr:hypothetical protein [Amycolatopsis marina]